VIIDDFGVDEPISVVQVLTKHLNQNKMIIVPVKDGENIERALKKFKRKFEKTGVVKELRARQQFDKPSVLKRLKMEHAVYVQKLRREEE
jgi:small subunit ribosomal protein S21